MIPFIAIFVYLSYVKFCSEKSDQNADFTRTGFRQKSCTLIEFPIKLTPLNRAEILNSFMVSETLILIEWTFSFIYLHFLKKYLRHYINNTFREIAKMLLAM